MGVRIFGRGVHKKGGSDEPPEPPLVTGNMKCNENILKVTQK